ncbi:type II secretion system F family protein [Desulfococcaceae bacterium HSG9]|nr:type II secretion system F family protein [Desulfococcaceae bacterium HSG9]
MIEQFHVADSRKDLERKLERDGYFVFEIKKVDGLMAFFKRHQLINRIKAKEFLAFNHEFVVLIKAGLPIVSALDAIIENEDERGLNTIIKQVRDNVATGTALSEAFTVHVHLFSYLYIATLEAGEKSGDLPLAISRYVRYTQKMAAIKQKIISASVYPSILTAVSIFTVLFLLVYVVPAFTQTYFESGTKLPMLTQVLVDFSNYIKTYYLYLAVFVIVVLSGLIFFNQSTDGKKKTDRWKTIIPFIGQIYRHYATSKFTRTLSTVLGGGTPLVESLKISIGALDNQYFQLRLKKVISQIEEGAGFAESLQKMNIFPKLAVKMLDAGEKGGALEQVLIDVADFYENDVDSKLEMLTSAIEPALMIIMGLIIGFIVLAMYLPIFQLAGTVS